MGLGFIIVCAASTGVSGTAWARHRYRLVRARRWASTWERVATSRGGAFRWAEVAVVRDAPPRKYSRAWWHAQPVARVRAMKVPALEIGTRDGDQAARPAVSARVAVGYTVGFSTFFESEFGLGLGPSFVLRATGDPGGGLAATTSGAGAGEGATLPGGLELEDGDPALAAAAVPERIAAALARVLPGARIDSNGLVVSVMAEGFCRTHEQLVAGLDAAQAIAGSDAYGLRAVRALRDAEPVERDPITELPAVELRLPEPVRVGPCRRGAGGCTAARTGAASAIDLRFELGRARAGRAAVPEALPREALPHLEQAGAGVLLSNAGRVAFEWAGIERDHDRLMAGARGVAAVARGLGRAVYR